MESFVNVHVSKQVREARESFLVFREELMAARGARQTSHRVPGGREPGWKVDASESFGRRSSRKGWQWFGALHAGSCAVRRSSQWFFLIVFFDIPGLNNRKAADAEHLAKNLQVAASFEQVSSVVVCVAEGSTAISSSLCHVLSGSRDIFGHARLEKMLLIHETKSAMLDEELLDQENHCFVSRLEVERQRRIDLVKVLGSGPSVKSTESGKVVESFPPGQGITYIRALASKFDQVTRPLNNESPTMNRSIEWRAEMLDRLCQAELQDCIARKEREAALTKMVDELKGMNDIKSRSALQDSMPKGMMGTMIAATEGDGSLAFLCRSPETHMRNIRSSANEFSCGLHLPRSCVECDQGLHSMSKRVIVARSSSSAILCQSCIWSGQHSTIWKEQLFLENILDTRTRARVACPTSLHRVPHMDSKCSGPRDALGVHLEVRRLRMV